jgi:hypothetical protein
LTNGDILTRRFPAVEPFGDRYPKEQSRRFFDMGRAPPAFKRDKVLAMVSGGRRLSDDEEREVRRELAELRQEHRDLDAAILAMAGSTHPDFIQIQRMKKRKLALKDRVAVLEDRLLPDIIA